MKALVKLQMVKIITKLYLHNYSNYLLNLIVVCYILIYSNSSLILDFIFSITNSKDSCNNCLNIYSPDKTIIVLLFTIKVSVPNSEELIKYPYINL